LKKSLKQNGTGPTKGTYRYHPTKGLVWHEVNFCCRATSGTICHGIVTDITERIEAEQKKLRLIDSTCLLRLTNDRSHNG
jgi:hypothetical protein